MMITAATKRFASWPAGWFPKGGYPCHTATNSTIASGNESNTCSPTSTTTANLGARGSHIANSSMVFCSASTPVRLGAMSHHAMGRGRPFTTASAVGDSTALGSVSSPTCSTTSKSTVGSVVTSGVSMLRSFALVALPAGRKKSHFHATLIFLWRNGQRFPVNCWTLSRSSVRSAGSAGLVK
jgi:hypothetical protein